jgi:hypothetical protein
VEGFKKHFITNDSNKIILIPTSGLANRLRIMAVSIKLARESGKKLVIYWDKNEGLMAEFKNLFEEIKEVSVQRIPLKYKIWIKMSPYSSKLLGLDDWYLRLFNFDFIFLDRMAELVWHNKLNLQKEVDRAKKVLICSGQEINHFNLKDYALFVPKLDLQTIIDAISKKFTTDTIGVHIRATDHEISKKYSPLPVFIKKMEDEIICNSEVRFFLATDEEKYQDHLLKKFGHDRIIFHKKVFGRSVTKGVKDAVVDLFCLSRTSKILGSYFSSFSQIAGRLGNIPVEILKIGE